MSSVKRIGVNRPFVGQGLFVIHSTVYDLVCLVVSLYSLAVNFTNASRACVPSLPPALGGKERLAGGGWSSVFHSLHGG